MIVYIKEREECIILWCELLIRPDCAHTAVPLLQWEGRRGRRKERES